MPDVCQAANTTLKSYIGPKTPRWLLRLIGTTKCSPYYLVMTMGSCAGLGNTGLQSCSQTG